jgi:SlyX protein
MTDDDTGVQSVEARLTDLEIRVSHQDVALDEVGDVLLRQQSMIDTLARQVDLLSERLRDARRTGGRDGSADGTDRTYMGEPK